MVWFETCMAILFKFNKNFKITKFSMQKWQKAKRNQAPAAEINLRSPPKAGLILVGDFSPTSRGLVLGVGGEKGYNTSWRLISNKPRL